MGCQGRNDKMMPTIDEIMAEMMILAGTQEGKDYIRHLIEDEVWYTGGDVCGDCNANERYQGTNGVITGILVAHDDTCPAYRALVR